MTLGSGAAVALAVKIVTDAKSAPGDIDKVTKSTSKLGKAGDAAGKLFAVGIGLAAVAGKKAADAALEDAVGQNKLANALKNATGARSGDIAAVEDWITAQGKALGVSDGELRPAMESLVTATKDVGKAQELAAIAMDISARKGLSLESVSKTLAKAHATGNVAALSKYGVATKDADGKTRDLASVQADLANAYKGAAASSPELAQKRLAVQTDELQEKFGAKLVPALQAATKAGLAVIGWVDRNSTTATVLVGALFALLAVVKLVSIATTLWSTATKIAAGAQAAFNFVVAANPILLIVAGVVLFVGALVLAYRRSDRFKAIVNAAFGAISSKVGAVVGFIKANWLKMLVILTGPIGLAVALIVKHWDKIKAGGLAVVTWVRDKWSAIKDLISGPVDRAKTLIGTAIENVKGKIDSIKTKAEGVKAAIETALSTAFKPIDTAVGWVTTLISKIESLIAWIAKIDFPDLPDLPGVRTNNADQSGGNGTRGLPGRPRGSASSNGGLTVQVVIPGGFVGDERTLARELRRILGHDVRRALGAT